MMRLLARLALLLALAGSAAGGFLGWARLQVLTPGPAAVETTVVIPPGSSGRIIAQQLSEAGVIARPWLFPIEVRLSSHPSLQAGEYRFPAHVSMALIIEMMHRGEVVVHKLTVAEGLTTQQIMLQLRETPGLSGLELTEPPEGGLLPQTYFFRLGDSRAAILARMSHGMTTLLDKLWADRDPGLPLTSKRQAVILASVVERETALPAERPHIAAVFLNRLRLHMRLQSDPTVIYAVSNGLGTLDRPLSHQDLAVNSPYNTYEADGLPPGPICNPGRASLVAVLHPAASDDLYFVADGSGGHVFAKSLSAHNHNVAKWRALRGRESRN